MNHTRMIVTAALAGALLTQAARAAAPQRRVEKAGPVAEARARARELRLGVRQDKQALKKDWFDWRRELAALKDAEAEERKAASASNAASEAKRAQLRAIAKKYASARATVRARRGPARIALKEKLKGDRSRYKRLRQAP